MAAEVAKALLGRRPIAEEGPIGDLLRYDNSILW